VIDRNHAEPIRIEIDAGARVDAIRDISFANMRVISATPPRLLGRPDKKLQDITLSNVSMTIRPPAEGQALPMVRNREAPFFGHIDNLVLDRVRIDLD